MPNNHTDDYSVGRGRPLRWVVVAAVLMIVAGAVVAIDHGFSWRTSVHIFEAYLTEPDQIMVTVATCQGDPVVDILEERSEHVRMRVTSTRTFGGEGRNDCLDSVTVRLSTPLASRPLIDATTGDQLVVQDGTADSAGMLRQHATASGCASWREVLHIAFNAGRPIRVNLLS